MNAIDALLQGKKGVVATKKTGKVSAIDQLLQKKPVKPTIQPVKTTLPTQQNYIKATLPKDLGGGSYYLQRGEPNKLITPEATKTYGSLKPKTGQERDHFIAQSLGGASDDYNLNYVPAEVNQAWAKIESKNLNAYKRGEISLPQARLNVLKEKQEWLMKQKGISQSVKDNLIYTAKDPVNPVNTARAVLKMVKSPVSLVKEYAKAIMPKTTAELETQIEAQKKSNQPMRFEVGAGMSNVEKVLPGPRISTLEAIQQGAQIEPVQAGEAPQVSPVRQAQQVVRKPDLSPEKPSAIDKLLSGIKLSYDTNPFMPSRSNPLQSNFEVALEPAEKKIFEKTLNTDLGKKVITNISKYTEDIPLKYLSGLEALGTAKSFSDFIPEAERIYSGWKGKKENENNPVWKKFIYNFQSSAPQSLLGVAMSFVPYAGKPLSYAYWSALSTGEQIKDKGEVTSAQNIAIDTIGDSLLGGALEGLFKKPAKTLISTLKKSFLTEGGTESAQTLLKYANDYRTAKNETDRNQAISNAKQYITSGDILMEFSIGGLSGASIGGLGFAANKTIGQQPGLSMPDKPTEPTGLQFSGQELLQPNQEMTVPTGPVLDFGSPSAVSQPAVEQQGVAGDVLPTKTTKVSPEVKPSVVEPLIEEAKKYKTADEFIQTKMAKETDFADYHQAPRMDKAPVAKRMEDGGDFSLREVANGKTTAPSDFFDERVGARYYMYDNLEGQQSFTAINNIIRAEKNGIKDRTITAYRAVPKNVKVDKLQDGDWVSFSKEYAEQHGMRRFDGKYKLIEQEVSPDDVWWDANDINEWGYDTGKSNRRKTVKEREDELKEIWNKAHKEVKPEVKLEEKPIPKELEPLAEEARKIAVKYPKTEEGIKKGAEELIESIYDKASKNKMSLQGWDWDKETGVKRYIIDFPFKKGAIETEYEVTIDKPIAEDNYKLSIRRKGEFLSNFDLKNINLKLDDYVDKQLFDGKEIIYSNLKSALNKVKELFPQAKEKPLEIFFLLTEPSQLTDFYNQAVKGTKEVKEVKKPTLPKRQPPKNIPPKKPAVVKSKTANQELIGKSKPVEKPTEFQSRVYDRIKSEIPEDMRESLGITQINMKKDAEAAVELLKKDKQKTFDIAMGVEKSNEVTATAANIAMFEEALNEGNYKLAGQLLKNRSLAQTRRGQELVAEKGSITDNSTSRYLKELISMRLDNVGRNYLDNMARIKKSTPKQRAIKKIDKEVASVEKRIKNKDLDVKTALKLLEQMTCLT